MSALVLLLLLGFQATAHGADPRLQVTPSAAYEGGFGLEVTVVPCLLSPDLELTSPPATVSGLYEACESVSVHGTQVGPSGALFRAGRWIEFGEGFVVPAGAEMEAALDSSLSPFHWVQDNSPAGETAYKALYQARLDNLSLAASETIDNFAGYSEASLLDLPLFRVILKRNLQLMEDRLLLAARLDDGSEATTPSGEELLLPSGWNRIEIDWRSGPGTGHLLVSLNNTTFLGLTGLANGQVGGVDHVQWGAVGSESGSAVVTSGSMELDSFRSWRQ